MNKLDLHGIPHAKVADMVEDFILLNEAPMGIITGNSNEMQKIVLVVLKKYMLPHIIHAHNLGEIIIL